MTSLLQGARKLLGRTPGLGDQIAGLEQAVEASRGRLDDTVLDPAATIAQRSGERMRLSPDHTVVALAGATGSGKSSTFNALTGLDLAAIGLRRPTTSWATACIWGGPAGAEPLLDWMGIPARHQYTRDSLLEQREEDRDLKGLVLLDLPDHDSTEVSHHLEVDRLVVLADLMIWVLDPQKYADAAIHETYLQPLAPHRDVMIVVLNHIDEVPLDRRDAMVTDVERLLAQDGLGGVPVVATSARDGDGVADLRALVSRKVADKRTNRERFRTDLRQAADTLDRATGSAPPRELSADAREELHEAVADSAGVPVVVDAVRRASRTRASVATGWPPLAWLSRLRPDPLKRLHLEPGRSTSGVKESMVVARSSLPQATQSQRARVDGAVRRVADEVSGGLSTPWVGAVRRASTAGTERLADRVDKAVAETPLGAGDVPAWCRVIQAVQWVALLCLIAGAGWLAVLAVMGVAQVDAPEAPEAGGFALPTLLLVLGAAVGVLLALLSQAVVGAVARSRARRADRRLRSAIAEVTDELVVAPVSAELDAYRRAREGIARAQA
ncbi:hypothetical protein GCM10011519_34690 [Marmoricola endophyticus]|uniref:G domain-containing protein n=1 Tax=Marmoricola endophyticus TaxID=2040280 RepID=A0A917FAK6_9ACTN|nr:GTPase [Marmoricola endophyticus]GGF57841.1 hypothetical protein GCM10011519_34690 [Marmoricola endophyticus]